MKDDMRIESITLGSVKSFATRQRLDLKRLNLIYGANSSGKSSILQTLLLLQQSAARAYSAERGVLEFRGGSVDLGGFRTFVHMHDTQRHITIGLRVGDYGLFGEQPDHGNSMEIDLDFGLSGDDSGSEAAIMRASFLDSARSRRITFERRTDGRMYLADAASATAVVDAVVREYEAMEVTPRRNRGAATELDKRWLRDWLRRQPASLYGWIPNWSPSIVARGRPGRPIGGANGSLRNNLAQFTVFQWADWSNDTAYRLFSVLNAFEYVGPLREFPRRVVTEASEGRGLGARGERLVLHLGRNAQLVDEVNRAFRELEIPYELAVNQFNAGKIEDALGDVAVAVLVDTRSGVVVSPADVGFGLSQILPVVVQLVGNRGSLIVIEQPEIHLHPKMQSRIADVMLRSVIEYGNTLLIETHSEHILFRLERRLRSLTPGMRNGVLGVNYVKSARGRAEIVPLTVDSTGRVVDPWPEGFFDEKLSDLLAD
jgi:hypothetical protein